MALTSGGSTMTRAEFKNALLSAFPMDAAASQGGTIILGSSGDISTTNPLLASDSTTINMLGQVFEPLLGASPIDGRPVPGLADSWTVSDDGLTYTFTLNTAAKWHDGVDVTADDVKFSFDAVLNPNLNSQYRSQVREVVEFLPRDRCRHVRNHRNRSLRHVPLQRAGIGIHHSQTHLGDRFRSSSGVSTAAAPARTSRAWSARDRSCSSRGSRDSA